MVAPYLAQVHAVLPRMLALFDTDPLSTTRGVGDRSYWGWKSKDFANATFQGAVHGLARLIRSGSLPMSISEVSVLSRIDDMVEALPGIAGSDGALAEAYPNESSFCVTALALYDVLVALDLLGERLSQDRRQRWLTLLAPFARFLHRADETHGFISNHLATAAAALFRWEAATGERSGRAGELLDRIRKAQSSEGWFPEYGGADPGYQTLCLHYLADLHLLCPDLGLGEPLGRCLHFLKHCAHPDGSFGGAYGWRGTRFLAPSGLEALASTYGDAAILAGFARDSIARAQVAPLNAFDEPNLPVMFNVWCWAAEMAGRAPEAAQPEAVPSLGAAVWRRSFPEAGVLFDKGPSHYTVVGWRKGGVLLHFRDSERRLENNGVACRNASGVVATTISLRNDVHMSEQDDHIVIAAPLVTSTSRLPGALDFAILRFLAITVLRLRPLNELFKRLLVGKIITGARTAGPVNTRTIWFGPDLHIQDQLSGSTDGWQKLDVTRPFHPARMASCGYWQVQDDEARQ